MVYEYAGFLNREMRDRSMTHEWQRGDYQISTVKSKLDLTVIHAFLSSSYWAAGIPLETVERSIEHSLCFGVYTQGGRQVGFARVVTDYATFAYIGDVFIVEAYRGQGLGTWLMDVVVNHPRLQGLRRWTLSTRDAHGLYAKFGFGGARAPERSMERVFPDVYAHRELP
jgi:GNAT superfamily N-acetyltransferase